MSDLLDRLQDMVDFKHDDMDVAREAIEEIVKLEAQNDMLRHATDKLRAMLTELNARHEPLQRAFITAVELLNDAALAGGKDE